MSPRISTIFLSSWMLSLKGTNLAAESGYVWFGTTTDCLIVVYFHRHEKGGRFHCELDILFHRKVPARKLTSTEGGLGEEECTFEIRVDSGRRGEGDGSADD